MKKAIVLLALVGFIGACTWDNLEDLEPDDPGTDPADPCEDITLSGSIMPIINANCNFSSCHGGGQQPSLSTNEGVIAKAKRILKRTSAGTMPPSGPLSTADIEKIKCWVDAGAPNN